MKLFSASKSSPAHENILIGILLSLLGGFLDAYTYTLENGVFANAQTGNLVLLAISALSGETDKIIKYLIPILMFASGILLSEGIKSVKKFDKNNRRIKLIILFESAIIVVVGLIGKSVPSSLVNCVVSFLAAIQVANFSKVNGVPVATTMITGNLRNSMEQFFQCLKTREKKYAKKTAIYLSVIVFFGVGASLGAYLSDKCGNYAILFCLTFLAFAYALIRIDEKKSA